MRILKRAFGVALVFAAVFLQTACDNSYGIFDEVQKEREQKGQDIFKRKSVTNIVTDGASYYASTARLYKRAIAGSEWSKVDIAGSADYEIHGLAAIGATVYASVSIDGVRGVYNVGTGASLGGVPSSSEALFAANGQLFLSRHEVDASLPVVSTYTLYHYTGATFEQVQNFSPAADKAIRGVAWDGAYLFASEDLLCRGSQPNGSDAAQIAFAKTIRSIASSDASGVNTAFVGTADGALYRYQGGTEASRTSGVASVPITAVVEVPLAAATWKILAGTGTASVSSDSQGYLEAATDDFASTSFNPGENGLVAANSSVYSTTVDDHAVNAFLYDAPRNTLLIGIASYAGTGIRYGLYSTVWSGSSWSGWKAE